MRSTRARTSRTPLRATTPATWPSCGRSSLGVPVVLGSATPVAGVAATTPSAGGTSGSCLPRRVRGLPMPQAPDRPPAQGDARRADRADRPDADTQHRRRAGPPRAGHPADEPPRLRQLRLLPVVPVDARVRRTASRAMVFHQATQLAMCHYCQATAPLPEHCPACKGKLLLFGLGIQRIEDELARKFPTGPRRPGWTATR